MHREPDSLERAEWERSVRASGIGRWGDGALWFQHVPRGDDVAAGIVVVVGCIDVDEPVGSRVDVILG